MCTVTDHTLRDEDWERIDRHVSEARILAGIRADRDNLQDPLHDAERILLTALGRIRDLRDADLARRR